MDEETLITKIKRAKQLYKDQSIATAEIYSKIEALQNEMADISEPFGEELNKLESEIGYELYLAKNDIGVNKIRGLLFETARDFHLAPPYNKEYFQGRYAGVQLISLLFLSEKEVESIDKAVKSEFK